MIRFEDVQERVEQTRPDADADLLRRAYIFCAMAHRGQTRYSGEPYLVHPLAVALILAELDLDVPTVATGLMHDTIEDADDYEAMAAELKEKFGDEIFGLVDGVTKFVRFKFDSAADRQAENLRKMILAMVGDIRIVLVKLADRLHNMRTLGFLPEHKRKRIAIETQEIFVPLANRLGLGQIKHELEDLSLQYVEPQIYDDLIAHLAAKKDVIDSLIGEVGQVLEDTLSEHEIKAQISGRVKSVYSIRKKMKVQEIDVGQVYDVVAFRVITGSIQDCYGAMGIIHGVWSPVPGRIKDYIAMPKPNLYRSLHTSVMSKKGFPFEIQIRTQEMHELAEQGIAAHWRYKDQGLLTEKEVAGVQWLREVMDWQQDVGDSREFSRCLKIDLFPEEVRVFTPKGRVIALPRGATPLDFAYAVHTEVGHTCVGARVRGKLVPLKTELENGDIVEILTQGGGKPKRDWLNIVKTARARSKIRHFLKQADQERSIELGRGMLDKELRRYSLTLKKIDDELIQSALEKLRLRDLAELHAALGYGKVVPGDFVRLIAPEESRDEESAPTILGKVRRVLRRDRDKVVVQGLNDTMVSLARCCNPIPGDTIRGYITRGRGVSVHTEDCPNLDNLLVDSNREIEVAWAGNASSTRFNVGLLVMTANIPGRLARVAELLEREKVNIRHADAEVGEGGEGVIRIVAEVENRKQVERLLDRIRRIEGVRHVERTSPSG